MGVTRTWIFPILRIIIFLAIAAALVKVAFFAAPVASSTPEFPTGEILEPQVPVALGTIQNEVSVQGTVLADDAVPVKATLAGDITKVLIGVGQPVAADTPVLIVKSETPGEVRVDGTVAPNKVTTVTVLAGSPGTLSSLPVIVGQTVMVGEAIAQVAPTTFSVSGPLAPEQQYRLLTRPADAQVTITGGPAPFTCTGLTITSALAGAGATPETDGAPATPSSGATVRCSVPAEITVFSGLAADLTLGGGTAENVMMVPVTAVEGGAGTGNVYVMLEDGATETKPVTLGITDGINVEITTGLAEGDMIMQFVPGAQEQGGIDAGNGCTSFPDGSMSCEG